MHLALAVLVGDNRYQKTSGVLKAKAIVQAASNLHSAAVTCADDLDPDEHRGAYTSVEGLGAVTLEYFTMLLGHPGIKADTWLTGWVTDAVGAQDRLSSREAHDLLQQAADGLGVGSGEPGAPTSTRLDRAIWKAASSR